MGYIRVSTAIQEAEGVSLDAQRAKLEAAQVALGFTLVGIKQEAASGKSLDRPELQAALAALRAGEANGLIVVKLDRLTRSVRDLGWLLDEPFSAQGEGFELVSLSESIDTSTAGGRLVLNVLGSVSQWEREAISERVQSAMDHLKASGVRVGAAPTGWRYTEETNAEGRRKLVEVPEEQIAIRRIQQLAAQGKTLREIVTAVTAEGLKTKHGGMWHMEQVRRLLAADTIFTEPATGNVFQKQPPPIQWLRTSVQALLDGRHTGPYVYMVFDPDNVPLYIGSSTDLQQRFRDHVSKKGFGLGLLHYFKPASLRWAVGILRTSEERDVMETEERRCIDVYQPVLNAQWANSDVKPRPSIWYTRYANELDKQGDKATRALTG